MHVYCVTIESRRATVATITPKKYTSRKYKPDNRKYTEVRRLSDT